MQKILITEFMEQDSVNKISEQFDVNYDPSLHENIEELSSQIASVDAIIVRNKTQLNEALLTKARKLRLVGRLGVGLDNIDTDYCSDKSIVVQPATGMNADSVAEYVISCSLSLLKNIPLAHQGTVPKRRDLLYPYGDGRLRRGVGPPGTESLDPSCHNSFFNYGRERASDSNIPNFE